MRRHAAGVTAPAPDAVAHPADELTDADLFHQLGRLYRTRLDTLRSGSAAALEDSQRRIRELEQAYLRRHPGREIADRRLRPSDDVPRRSPIPRLN